MFNASLKPSFRGSQALFVSVFSNPTPLVGERVWARKGKVSAVFEICFQTNVISWGVRFSGLEVHGVDTV